MIIKAVVFELGLCSIWSNEDKTYRVHITPNVQKYCPLQFLLTTTSAVNQYDQHH